MLRYVRKHIRGALGAIALLPTIYHVFRWILDFAGYADLLIGHANALQRTWVYEVMAVILKPPGWLELLLLIGGGLLIWWDLKRSKLVGAPKSASLATISPELSCAPQATPRGFNEIWAELLTEKEKRAAGYGKVFEIVGGKAVKLRFPPYSNDPIPDALLLVLLAYQDILGVSEVRNHSATESMYTGGVEPPLERFVPLAIIQRQSAKDVVRERLSDCVEVSGLAKGGILKLNELGYKRACGVVWEMIRRA